MARARAGFDRSGRFQPSKALETAVFIELMRRGAQVSYVQTAGGFEVDFLARFPGGRQELVQVCAEARDAATEERELRALLTAREEHPGVTPSLVTLLPEGFRRMPEQIPVWEAGMWLLSTEM